LAPFLVLNFSRIVSARAAFDRRRLLTVIAIVFCGMGDPQPEY
jgi:hypothetical protein